MIEKAEKLLDVFQLENVVVGGMAEFGDECNRIEAFQLLAAASPASSSDIESHIRRTPSQRMSVQDNSLVGECYIIQLLPSVRVDGLDVCVLVLGL